MRKKSTATIPSLLAALDIGTSKVATIAARLDDDGKVNILAVSTVPSGGLKKGAVVNVEETVNSIRESVKEAEIIADVSIHKVYIDIAGKHIRCINGEGAAPIRDKEVSQGDMDRAVETAKAIQLPADQMILHALPKDFTVDDETGIKDPLGMSGYKLQAFVHMVTAGRHQVRNVEKCVEQCGLEVADVVLDQIASSYSVLTDDEKELGVCLLDIGGGTTDLAVFHKGALVHTAVIGVGGDHVTHDIAVALRTPTKNAESVKIKYGCAWSRLIGENETIEVLGVADRPASRHKRQALAMIIEPRYEELFELVNRELQSSVMNKCAVTGFVLTGGSSKIEGAADLAGKVFNAPTRVGRPQTDRFVGMEELINNPIYATGAGLLLYAVENYETEGSDTHGTFTDFKSNWNRLGGWFRQIFN